MASAHEAAKGPERRILIVGHTGTGKSTLGNILLDRQLFSVGKSFTTPTTETESFYGERPELKLKVLDTPDLKNNVNITQDEITREVISWKHKLQPSPHAVLLTIRSDVPFTKSDVEVHRQIIFTQWSDGALHTKIIVIFTFGDRCSDSEQFDATNNPYLIMTLNDALGHYVVFRGPQRTDRVQFLEQILRIIEEREPNSERHLDDESSHEIRLLILGKTGSGKSTLGNFLLGRQPAPFAVSPKANLCFTRTAQLESTPVDDSLVVKVVDTPYLLDPEFDTSKRSREVKRWKDLLRPEPFDILLTVLCDEQFSGNQYTLYREIKKLFGEKEFKRRLSVAFTYSDQLEKGELENVLKDASPGLKEVLKDAGNRHYFFSATASKTRKQLLIRRYLQDTETIANSSVSLGKLFMGLGNTNA